MSRILVVQPHRMLQQALVVALLPDHEVQVFDKIPAVEVLAAAELLIIDAAALWGGDAWSTRDVRAIQSCRVPLVWIDAQTPPDTAAFTNLVRLAPPLKRDELRAAAAECLRLTGARPSAASKPARTVAAKTKAIEPKSQTAAPDKAKEFIELVDVFEETPKRDEINAEARNKD
jgi:hypothetical protein